MLQTKNVLSGLQNVYRSFSAVNKRNLLNTFQCTDSYSLDVMTMEVGNTRYCGFPVLKSDFPKSQKKLLLKKSTVFSQNVRFVTTNTSTVDSKEIQQFQRYSSEWWNELGPMKPLHLMNRLRIPLIRDGLINSGITKAEKVNSPQPLMDVSILDIGCGGGILSEPLAKLGANVTGIDANQNIIDIAKCHATQNKMNITYCASSIEEHATNNSSKYDAIVASEIVEHVTQKNEFIEAAVKCLKPRGSIFITTMNKTMLANVLGIIVSENILGLIPKGTHQYDKFIEPHKMQRILEDNNCRTTLIHGMFYNFLTSRWSWCSDTSISYGLHAVKL